tara:strand:- start:88 stop:399 length:312 start_codon:yes stop_codon:yes gene_type:complete
MELKESSGIKFSLSFLIQVLGTVIIAVWGYSQLDQRINMVSNMSATHSEKLKNIELDIKENQDKPIPSDHVQNTKIFAQERELRELKERITILEARVYHNNRE